jgi:hypothetical protein
VPRAALSGLRARQTMAWVSYCIGFARNISFEESKLLIGTFLASPECRPGNCRDRPKPNSDTAGEFPPAADQPETEQDELPKGRKCAASDAPSEFASSINIRVTRGHEALKVTRPPRRPALAHREGRRVACVGHRGQVRIGETSCSGSTYTTAPRPNYRCC